MVKEIENIVRDLLVDFGYYQQSQRRFDVVQFARNHGFSVRCGNLPYKYNYSLIMKSDRGNGYGEKIIILNQDESVPHKRLFIARALSHAFLPPLHCKRKKSFLRQKEDEDNIENYFAAALLMPEESFRNTYRTLKDRQMEQDDIYVYLTILYRVPTKSVRYRIKQLELEDLSPTPEFKS